MSTVDHPIQTGRLWRSNFVKRFRRGEGFDILLIRNVFPAFAGAAIPVAIGFVYSDVDRNGADVALLLIMCALVLVLVALFAAVLRLIYDEETRGLFRVSLSKGSYHDEAQGRTSTAFFHCTAVANRAIKSIYVVGPHFSSHLPTGSHTTSHDEYLSRGMKAALDRHSEYDPEDEQHGRQFEYFRVIQMGPDEVKFVKDHQIPLDAMGDNIMAHHVDHALGLGRKYRSIDVKVFAGPYVPSLPSILVIDERHVFFSLPSLRVPHVGNAIGVKNGGADATGKHATRPSRGEKSELHYDFVFEIEDVRGDIARNFITLIKQIANNGTQIKEVIR